VDAMLADLRESVEKARSLASGDLAAKISAAFANVDPASIGDDTIRGLLAMSGAAGNALPDRMAEVNEVLNALPVPIREKLLVGYLNTLYRQPDEESGDPG
jgi:hypothetical protein